jgi:chromosome partitioning protein
VADLVLVPLVPSVLDLAAAEPLLEALGPTGRALVVLNQVIPRANVTADARAILASLKVRVARAELGRRVAHIEAALARQAVIDYAPRSRAAAELLALAREVGRLMEAKQ